MCQGLPPGGVLDSSGNLPDTRVVKALVPEPKKRGFPRPRYERLEARVTAELKEMLLDAAAMRGVTLSDFLINSAHDAAVRTVEQHRILRLNREASLQFAKALLDPPKLKARKTASPAITPCRTPGSS